MRLCIEEGGEGGKTKKRKTPSVCCADSSPVRTGEGQELEGIGGFEGELFAGDGVVDGEH